LLTSLTFLNIDGRSIEGEGEKVQFPSEEEEDEEDASSLLFPSSLTSLWIDHMRNVGRLLQPSLLSPRVIDSQLPEVEALARGWPPYLPPTFVDKRIDAQNSSATIDPSSKRS